MKGEVFIAWGANEDLAKEVAEKLKADNFIAQIGGIEDDPLQSSFYLGQQIMNQIKRASRAIILAQKSPKNRKKMLFRPNLMLEWGMLTGRLNASLVHVFLIGLKRSELPSDLQGSWATEIDELDDINNMSKNIVEKFKSQISQACCEPTKVIREWDSWKYWIENQLNKDVAPDYYLLAGVLLHSIQPAFYGGDIEFLLDKMVAIGKISNIPPVLTESIRISTGACLYYKGVERNPDYSTLNRIISSLKPTTRDEVEDSEFKTWLEIIRKDFLGLLYWKLGQISPPNGVSPNNYTMTAKDLFLEVNDLLKDIKNSDKVAFSMWKGYVLRNIGRIYAESFDNDLEASKFFTQAHSARERAWGDLQNIIENKILKLQFYLEVKAVEIDLLKYGFDIKNVDLDSVINTLIEQLTNDNRFEMYNLVVSEAKQACSILKRDDLLKKLNSAFVISKVKNN